MKRLFATNTGICPEPMGNAIEKNLMDRNISVKQTRRLDFGFFGAKIVKFSVKKVNFLCFQSVWRTKMQYRTNLDCILTRFWIPNTLK